jgi:hypothetical protein
VTQRVPVEARGLVDKFNIERLPLGLDCFTVREAKLLRCVSHELPNDVNPPITAPPRAENAEM